MRFTVTLDEDVAAGIRREMERSGASFKQVVNSLMRRGFDVPHRDGGEKSRAGRVSRRKNSKGPD
jgi:hypothetical protein